VCACGVRTMYLVGFTPAPLQPVVMAMNSGPLYHVTATYMYSFHDLYLLCTVTVHASVVSQRMHECSAVSVRARLCVCVCVCVVCVRAHVRVPWCGVHMHAPVEHWMAFGQLGCCCMLCGMAHCAVQVLWASRNHHCLLLGSESSIKEVKCIPPLLVCCVRILVLGWHDDGGGVSGDGCVFCGC
jgi:hypothetical protein